MMMPHFRHRADNNCRSNQPARVRERPAYDTAFAINKNSSPCRSRSCYKDELTNTFKEAAEKDTILDDFKKPICRRSSPGRFARTTELQDRLAITFKLVLSTLHGRLLAASRVASRYAVVI